MQFIMVADRQGSELKGEVLTSETIIPTVALLQVYLPTIPMEISIIIYNDGSQWTPKDWLDRCLVPVEIPDLQWVRQDGRPGILFNGLPRAID